MKAVKPELMNEHQAARWLNVSISTLRRARQAGKVKFYRIGWRVTYTEQQLREFLTEHCQPMARPNAQSQAAA